MKKFTSLFIALTLIFTLTVPAFATAPTSALGEGTLDQRIAFIKENYNLTVVLDWEPYYGTSMTTDQASTYLGRVESALSILGNSFVKQVSSKTSTAHGKDFKVVMWIGAPFNQPAVYGTADNMIEMYTCKDPTTFDIIHEFGHALDNSNAGGSSTLWNAFTGMHSYPIDSSLSVSWYGATAPKEDIAETFAHMVYYGGNTPNSSNATITAKKMIILDWLISEVGTGSNATKRAAAHMGIDLDTYK